MDARYVTPGSRPTKRTRSGSFRRPSGRQLVTRVPRAIRTRGTPDGYYEIPTNVLLRFYFNTSTGVWDTNQANGAALGTTGYPGVGFRFTHGEIYAHFGDSGVINRTAGYAIPFATELGTVFDECKTPKIHMEMWLANQTPGGHTTTGYDPEFWLVEDRNDAFPPGSDAIQQYAKCIRVLPDKVAKMTLSPAAVLDQSADAGTGGTTAAAMSSTGYMRTGSFASLYGAKMFYWIPNTGANTYVGYLNIKFTIVRRYKRTR